MKFQLLGSSKEGEHCFGITKGLLNFLAKLSPDESISRAGKWAGKKLFSSYLRSFVLVGMDLNLNAFSRWANGERDFYSSLFGKNDKKEPKNFSFSNQFDVARLGQMLNLNLIFYCAESEKDLHRLNVFHNYTDFEDPTEPRKSYNFLLTYSGQLFFFFPSPDFKDIVRASLIHITANPEEEVTKLDVLGLGESLCRLLECEDSFSESEVLSKVKSVRDLVYADSGVTEILSTLPAPLVVAVYTRRGSISGNKKKKGDGQMFNKCVLEIVYKSDILNYNASGRNSTFKLPSIEEIDFLVSPAGTNALARANNFIREKMYGLLGLLSAEDKFDCSYVFSGMSPGKDFDDRLRVKRAKAEEKRRKKYAREGEPEKKKRRKIPEENCECKICRDSMAEYEFNMNLEGPEQLLTIDFSCRDLLSLLGLDTEENLAIVNRMVEMSIASFDIESKTVDVDSTKPDSSQFAELDPQMSVEGHCKKVQRPIMIAHMDALDPGDHPQSWTVDGDDEKQCYKMFKRYFDNVLMRRNRAESIKYRLCEPLFATLTIWIEELTKFLRERPPDPDEKDEHPEVRILAAVRNSLPGRLVKKLGELCHLYVVFSFYGSGYDHVLLLGYLAPYWYEKRLRPKIEKRGNKVTSISLKNRITFRDVTKMLAPGTDLRNFGKLFGLEQKKAHFPFSILTSVDVLDQPTLPEDEESWRSDLGGKAVGRQEIEEALELFREAKCESVGDYLRTYLKLDVVVLFKSVLLWRKSLIETVGVDFVESKKFTISSMSNYAGSRCQAERLRVGSFFPNNRRHYGLLKKGMRG